MRILLPCLAYPLWVGIRNLLVLIVAIKVYDGIISLCVHEEIEWLCFFQKTYEVVHIYLLVMLSCPPLPLNNKLIFLFPCISSLTSLKAILCTRQCDCGIETSLFCPPQNISHLNAICMDTYPCKNGTSSPESKSMTRDLERKTVPLYSEKPSLC